MANSRVRHRRVRLAERGIAVDHIEAGRCWNDNADAWTKLARAGYDTYRDHLNTPAFFEMLPDVCGLRGVDIGCGEGGNTRLLAKRGARVVGIDISERFIAHAREEEGRNPAGIEYRVASAVELPFDNAHFDFATGFMSFMDIPELDRVVAEAHRVLRRGGFLQFSIAHPCFDTAHRKQVRDRDGMTLAIEVGQYFRRQHGEMSEWIFSSAPPQARAGLPLFKTPRFTRTLSEWLNLLLDAGFVIERVGEPRPSDEVVRQALNLQDAQVVAYFLHIRARKP